MSLLFPSLSLSGWFLLGFDTLTIMHANSSFFLSCMKTQERRRKNLHFCLLLFCVVRCCRAKDDDFKRDDDFDERDFDDEKEEEKDKKI